MASNSTTYGSCVLAFPWSSNEGTMMSCSDGIDFFLIELNWIEFLDAKISWVVLCAIISRFICNEKNRIKVRFCYLNFHFTLNSLYNACHLTSTDESRCASFTTLKCLHGDAIPLCHLSIVQSVMTKNTNYPKH